MNPQDRYIHIDIMNNAIHVDIVHDIEKPLPIRDNYVQEILANHVIEHISWRQLPFVFNDWNRVLRKGGTVAIRTPNLDFITNMFIRKNITPEAKQDEGYIKKHFGGKISPTMYAILKLFSGQDYLSNFHYACWSIEELIALAGRHGFCAFPRKIGDEFSPGEIQMIMTKVK
jgi:predicted SAM-dependent methyltransferase